MDKIVILSCTNRPDSNTLKVSRIYENILKSRQIDAKILDFCTLPENIAFAETFGKRTENYGLLIEEFISTRKKFIFVVPEYNGSFPGILKLFLDSTHPRDWSGKKACLVGVSDGRAGNLRGMDHLTGILHYLKMHVLHNKLPISVIAKVMSDTGSFIDGLQMKASEAQVDEFLEY
ncbi:MAG: NAD(P)H-dependent oxidoreductase [Bacteroidota bacterium]